MSFDNLECCQEMRDPSVIPVTASSIARLTLNHTQRLITSPMRGPCAGYPERKSQRQFQDDHCNHRH